MKHGFPFLLFLIFLVSCGSENQNRSPSTRTVTFQKLDSIRIEYLGNPTVHDLDPTTGTVLFMEHREFSEDIMVADFDGSIRAAFSKDGDIPDSYGALMSTLRIDGDSSFIAYGYNGFLTYDFNGKLQSSVKLKDFQVPNFSRKSMGFGMEKLGNKYLYFDQGSRHVDYSSIDVYQELQLLNWLDPKTGKREPIIQFPETSIFRNGKHFPRDSWVPVFSLVDDLIYLAFRIEPVLYIYESEAPYSLVSSIPLSLKDYRYFKGSDNFSLNLSLLITSGRIENIKKVGDYFLVAYFPGYNELDTKEANTVKSPEERRLFWERMAEKYAPRIAVLDSMGNRLNDFVPEGLVASSMLLRNGELWMLETPDDEVERDYFRLFRVGLKFD